LAQLRQDYERFVEHQAEILVVGPDGPRAFQRTWEKEGFPFVGLYEQEVIWLKLGRMPAVLVVDKEGHIRYRHHGSSMSDIPDNGELLSLLETLS
jgi:peroxiredoxin